MHETVEIREIDGLPFRIRLRYTEALIAVLSINDIPVNATFLKECLPKELKYNEDFRKLVIRTVIRSWNSKETKSYYSFKDEK